MKNKQEFRGTPRCTGRQIVEFGLNLTKIFNNRNMDKVTNARTERERKRKRKRQRERDKEKERTREREQFFCYVP